MTNNIRKRIERLEQRVPEEIILGLKDGSVHRHPGPPLKFFMDTLEQIRNCKGQLFDAIRHTTRASGCGHIWEVLQAVTDEAEKEKSWQQ